VYVYCTTHHTSVSKQKVAVLLDLLSIKSWVLSTSVKEKSAGDKGGLSSTLYKGTYVISSRPWEPGTSRDTATVSVCYEQLILLVEFVPASLGFLHFPITMPFLS
jgi:hypothetical protein